MNPLRLLDIILVVVTAPVVVLLGAPALGILVGAAAWVLQRVAEFALEREAKRRESIKAAIGLNLAGAMGRAWLVGLTILAVGTAGDRQDGLAAAILTFVAFTLYFVNMLLTRTLERNSATS